MYFYARKHAYISEIYTHMVINQNSSIPKRLFFANKNFIFTKFSRIPSLSFTGPILANNTIYKDLFITCQITPKNYGSLLGNLLNMQLISHNSYSRQIFFAKFTGPPPVIYTVLCLFPTLLHNFREIY